MTSADFAVSSFNHLGWVDRLYVGLIVTEAHLELLDYEDDDYWSEITELFDCDRMHVT